MNRDFLNELHIASPCSVRWERMTGSDRIRLCNQCDLHVYDISELTRTEAVALIANSEGRICARLHRRADGTVITRDCPVGLRALRKRLARRTGAAFAALLGLSATLFAQTGSRDKKACPNINVTKTIEKQSSPQQKAVVAGIVRDANGAVIPRARLTLTGVASKEKFATSATDAGEFRFTDLQSGEYTLVVVSTGFKRLMIAKLGLKAKETVRLEVMLEPKGETVTMGVVAEAPTTIYTNEGMTLSGDLIRRLPH